MREQRNGNTHERKGVAVLTLRKTTQGFGVFSCGHISALQNQYVKSGFISAEI